MNILERYPVRQGEGSVQASNDLSTALVTWMEKAGATGLFRTCATCKNMERIGPAVCILYQSTPPVAVIIKGCDKYVDETEIPY